MAQYAVILQTRSSQIRSETAKIVGLKQELRIDLYETGVADFTGNSIPRYTQYLCFESKNSTFDASTISKINAAGGIIFNSSEECHTWLKQNTNNI